MGHIACGPNGCPPPSRLTFKSFVCQVFAQAFRLRPGFIAVGVAPQGVRPDAGSKAWASVPARLVPNRTLGRKLQRFPAVQVTIHGSVERGEPKGPETSPYSDAVSGRTPAIMRPIASRVVEPASTIPMISPS